MDVKTPQSDTPVQHLRGVAPEVQGYLDPPEGEDDLIEKNDHSRVARQHQIRRGLRAGRNLGIALLLAGIAITLHAYWTISTAVLETGSAPTLRVDLGTIELMQATLGLYLVALGGITVIVLGFPLLGLSPTGPAVSQHRLTPHLKRLRLSLKRNNSTRWTGFTVLLAGALLAGFGLREIAHSGHPGVVVDGVAYRVHWAGYLLLGVGGVIFAWAGARQTALVRAVQVVELSQPSEPEHAEPVTPVVPSPTPESEEEWMTAPLTREEQEAAMYEYGEDYDVPEPGVRG